MLLKIRHLMVELSTPSYQQKLCILEMFKGWKFVRKVLRYRDYSSQFFNWPIKNLNFPSESGNRTKIPLTSYFSWLASYAKIKSQNLLKVSRDCLLLASEKGYKRRQNSHDNGQNEIEKAVMSKS